MKPLRSIAALPLALALGLVLIAPVATAAPLVIHVQGTGHASAADDRDARIRREVAAHDPDMDRLVAAVRQGQQLIDQKLANQKACSIRPEDADDLPAQSAYAKSLVNSGDAGDRQKGLQWYTCAADAGNGQAAMALGGIYATAGPAYDAQQALSWYDKASDLKQSAAHAGMARIYATDPNLKDPNAVIRHYKLAGEVGNDASTNILCTGYDNEPVELHKAALEACIDLYHQGEIADDNVLFALGMILYDGTIVPQNLVSARNILAENLAMEKPAAAFLGGRMQVEGAGGPVSLLRGVMKIQRAATMAPDPIGPDVRGDAQAWLDSHGDLVAQVAAAELDLGQLPAKAFVLPRRASRSKGIAVALGQVAADKYPDRALKAKVEGKVTFRCFWFTDGQVRECWPDTEIPKGYDFGDASTDAVMFNLQLTPEAAASTASPLGRWSDFEVNWTLP